MACFITLTFRRTLRSLCIYGFNFLAYAGYCDHSSFEIFSFTALETAWKNATSEHDKEHVTPYIYTHLEKFNILTLKSEKNLSQFRWALDYENDLKLIRIIISKIQKRPILMNDILELFEQEPDLTKIN